MGTRVIGTTTKYLGQEYGMHGRQVRIAAILRRGPGVDPESEEAFVSDDATLQRLGGVTKHDRIDVYPILRNGTVSWIPCDPGAGDLECFAHLREGAGK